LLVLFTSHIGKMKIMRMRRDRVESRRNAYRVLMAKPQG
jgi:hypothetical protein